MDHLIRGSFCSGPLFLGSPIVPVGEPGEELTTHDERGLGAAAAQELVGDADAVDEARTGGRQVESGGATKEQVIAWMKWQARNKGKRDGK